MLQVITAFALLAAGFGLHAMHANVCRRCEVRAYQNGYDQAQKEQRIRQEAMIQAGPVRRPVEVPPEFSDRLRTNGRAVVKMQ